MISCSLVLGLIPLAALVLAGGCGEPTGLGQTVSPFEIVDEVNTPGYAEGVFAEHGIVFVADGQGGLVIVTETEGEFEIASRMDFEYISYSVVASSIDSTAFVTDLVRGVQFVDYSNPASPIQLGFGESTHAEDVAVFVREGIEAGYWVCLADRDGGLRLWAQDPYYPGFFTQLDREYLPGYALGVDASGDHIYVADGQMGLQVCSVDVSGRMTLISWVDTPGNAQAVEVADELALVADGLAGLQIIDASVPDSVTLLGSIDLPGYATDVTSCDEVAFVACETAGVIAVDISDPEHPKTSGVLDTPYANSVYTDGDLIYIGDRDRGLIIAQFNE
jgi:hypothetical protein